MDASKLRENDGDKIDIQNCRVRTIVHGKLYQCVTEKQNCEHRLAFGNSKFCKHPMNHKMPSED